ncbi:MAG TPA: amino acid ABC transporter permease [Spirochaetota bacterium]|nr:amino acid ABC transporter permease [Spirochaetota bacterium]HPF05912.1 amino acid ABC transporter permease [Spirochaetota bacterium]HPJ42421.1 amino acid ABC transporter permease [Spirochaetota bacterium]HPR37600.1 amino acid ABC transporter permease [Spirochaetota bacterium]HRX46790.1 amino acid ABC transporter permease [Spirochaetota bacterium]
MDSLLRLGREYGSLFALLAFLCTVLIFATGAVNYEWQWWRVPEYIKGPGEGISAGPLLLGLAVTLEISSLSMVFAIILGMGAALLRLSDSVTGRFISYIYIESIRNTPLIVQIFVMYFAVSPIFGFSAFTSAVTALSLFEGAYISEIIRAGVVSIRKGQWEAALSLGMGRFHVYRYIVLPQALRRVLPPLTGQGISLIKDSALVSTISIYDLTMMGQSIVSETFLTFEIWFTVAVMYLTLTVALSFLSGYIEKRFNVH